MSQQNLQKVMNHQHIQIHIKIDYFKQELYVHQIHTLHSVVR